MLPFKFGRRCEDFLKSFNDDVADSLKVRRRQVIPNVNMFGLTHGTIWKSQGDYLDDTRGELRPHSVSAKISYSEILDGEVDMLVKFRHEIVEGLTGELMRTMYQAIFDSTQESGNIVDAGGDSFRAEHFLEVLEKIEFAVDRDGNVVLPEIHASPEQAERMLNILQSQSEDFERKVDEIKKRKSSEAIARESLRRSKFPPRLKGDG